MKNDESPNPPGNAALKNSLAPTTDRKSPEAIDTIPLLTHLPP